MLRFNVRQTLDTMRMQDYFNTSYVTVQHLLAILNTIMNNISIHPMLRFNNQLPEIMDKFSEFQYILCYGSTLFHKKTQEEF